MFKKLFLSLLVGIYLISFSELVLSQEREYRTDLEGGIKKDQPISVGETIYFKLYSTQDVKVPAVYIIISHSYIYMGIEGGSIKIKHTDYTDYGDHETEESDILILPLNANKQALLKVKTLREEKPETELLITVVDDFNRITVKYLKSEGEFPGGAREKLRKTDRLESRGHQPVSQSCWEGGYESGYTFGTLERKEGLPFKPEIAWNKKKTEYQKLSHKLALKADMQEEEVIKFFKEGWIEGYEDAHQGKAKRKTRIEEYWTEDYGGIGAEVTIMEGFPTIVTSFEGTPARKAGLKTGDKIVKIDGTSTKGFALWDVTEKVMGKPGTDITLTILREKKEKPFDIKITRSVISLAIASLEYFKFGETTLDKVVFDLESKGIEYKSEQKGLGYTIMYKYRDYMDASYTYVLSYEDVLYKNPAKIELYFTPKTKKLYWLEVRTDSSKDVFLEFFKRRYQAQPIYRSACYIWQTNEYGESWDEVIFCPSGAFSPKITLSWRDPFWYFMQIQEFTEMRKEELKK